MAEGSSGKVKEISLGGNFGDVAVKVNGTRIEVHADGSIDVSPPSAVRVHPPANDTEAKLKTAFEVGDEMEDGTIYAGISPDTNKAMYATPEDAPGAYAFKQAAKYAKNLEAHGHHDWRVPTKNELDVLYEKRNKGKLAGTFNLTGSLPAGWYCSSSPGNVITAWAQRFSDGAQGHGFRLGDSSLRCVRG
jgi:Protein of unknown function (DUF1566)